MADTVYTFEGANPFDTGDAADVAIVATGVSGGSCAQITTNAQYTVAAIAGEDHGPDLHVGAWVRGDDLGGHNMKGIGLTIANQGGTGDTGYQCFLDFRNDTINIRLDWQNGTEVEGSVSGIALTNWYWMEVEWTTGTITATLYDAPGGASMGSVTKNDSTYSSGLVGISSYSEGSVDSLTIFGTASGDRSASGDRTLPSLTVTLTAGYEDPVITDRTASGDRVLPSLTATLAAVYSDPTVASGDPTVKTVRIRRESDDAILVEESSPPYDPTSISVTWPSAVSGTDVYVELVTASGASIRSVPVTAP